MRKQIKRGLIAASSFLVAGAAMAQTSGGTTVDTSSITAAGATIATVGAAVFAVVVGLKTWKWIQRAL